MILTVMCMQVFNIKVSTERFAIATTNRYFKFSSVNVDNVNLLINYTII